MELERWVYLRFCYVLDLYFLVSFLAFFPPHLCVGFLFLVVHFRLAPLPLPPASSSHTTCHHTTCSHTTYLLTHNVCPHNLLPPQLAHKQLAHKQLLHTQLVHTQLDHGRAFCVAGLALMALGWLWWRAWFPVDAVDAAARRVAGVALGDMDVHSARQAWHLWHWAGSGGAFGSQLTPWTPRLFAWQAWHLSTWTCILRGRRGTWRHGRAFCVAGVALWHWAGSGGALGSQLTPWTPRLFAWQAWHLATWTCILRGRLGTCGTVDAAGLAQLGAILAHLGGYVGPSWGYVDPS